MGESRVVVGAEGIQVDLAKFDLGTLCLERNLAGADRRAIAMVDQIPVHPDHDFVALADDFHAIPPAQLHLGAIGEVVDVTGITLESTPLLALLAGTALLHVGHLDVLSNAPEIPGVLVLHLHLNGGREHVIEDAGRRAVDQNPAIARLTGEAVFHHHPVIRVIASGDQMPARLADAHQLALAHDKAGLNVRILVGLGHIRLPAIEVLAVEELDFGAHRHRPVFPGIRPQALIGDAGGEDEGASRKDEGRKQFHARSMLNSPVPTQAWSQKPVIARTPALRGPSREA